MIEIKEALARAKGFLGPEGACLGSKSGYRRAFPRNLVVFNANIVAEGLGKIWWGDIDLSSIEQENRLRQAALSLARPVMVFPEMPMQNWLETENIPSRDYSIYWTDGIEAGLKAGYSSCYSREGGVILETREET